MATAAPARIVFLDRETLPPQIHLKAPGFAHEIVCHDATPREQVGERIADADIVITNKVPIGEAELAGAPGVRLIAVAATGYDVIDLDACRGRGVAVANIRDYAGTTVPEHVLALMLALRRNIPGYLRSVREGAWQHSGQFCYFERPIHDLNGATLGIIGSGALGQGVARLARAFGMRVLFAGRKGAADIKPGHTPFDEVLGESDVLTLHLPMTPETKGLIGRPEFARMTKQPLLINTARGGLVDEQALIEALETDRIAGAGFDVASREPMPNDHPFMSILDRPNFILTPHTAWGSLEAIQTLADQLIDNIDNFWSGAPTNLVS